MSTPQNDDLLLGKISLAYEQLAEAAGRLNTVSDDLAEAIGAIEGVLQSLNIGLAQWVQLAGDIDGDAETYWSRDIGYAKIGSKWAIGLRTVQGTLPPHRGDDPDENEHVEEWLFNDAPRWLRLEGVGKLGDLLEALTKEANRMSSDIKAKVTQARAISLALTAAQAKAKTALRKK